MISGLEIRDASTGAHPTSVVGGTRRATIVVHVTEVVPLAAVPADDPEQPRPAGRDARQRSGRSGGRARPEPRPADRMRAQRAAAACRAATASTWSSRARNQIQDGLQAAAFFDVHPGVVGGRPMPLVGADGDVALTHVWRLPAQAES